MVAQTKAPPAPRPRPAPAAKPAPPKVPVETGVGNGHIPARGPVAAPARPAPKPSAPAAPRPVRDQPTHPDAPHVHASNDAWIGHSTGRNDPHYHLEHPWQYGHFPQVIGARHIWRLHGGTRERFDIGGYFFSIAPYDFDYTGDWLWDTDDIVLYPDPDHDGWYLAYNVRLGTYAHVMYLGQ
jgi:hypothetical protein